MKAAPLLVCVAVFAFSTFLLTMGENKGLRMLTSDSNNKSKYSLLHIEAVGPMPKMIQSPKSDGICKENAIVYMAQKHHSSYDRDSYGLLKQSLDLLYKNYLNDNHNATNLFIFHTGEFDAADLRDLEERGDMHTKGLMNFVDLTNTSYWHIPPWLRKDDPNKWSQHAVYSVGYRHMVSCLLAADTFHYTQYYCQPKLSPVACIWPYRFAGMPFACGITFAV